MSLTKIVATIGPASESSEMIERLILSGVNVFRFNLKHNELSWHKEKILLVKQISEKLKIPVGVLIDLQGPEIRLMTPNAQDVVVKLGQKVVIKRHKSKDSFTLSDDIVLESMKEGGKIVVDDGKFVFLVSESSKNEVTLEALSEGILKTRKTLNIPGIYCPLSALTKHDKEAITSFSDLPVDFVALSFVRNTQDVEKLRAFMKKKGMSARIISKIETKLAIDNIDEIIDVSEGIMVARGDLGVEVPLEQVPFYQKAIIKKCLERGFPVITATQMIHSMIDRPYPTRAEISDIANASYDMTDTVMLSEESAAGSYPERAVTVMNKTIDFNEKKVFIDDTREVFNFHIADIEEMLCDTAYNMYLQFKKKDFKFGGFIVFSETGRTARKLSRYRPNLPIYVFTPNKRVRDSLTLNYGVVPILQPKIFKKGKVIRIEDMQNALAHLKKMKLYDTRKHYILFYGDNWMVEGRTSTLKILSPSK